MTDDKKKDTKLTTEEKQDDKKKTLSVGGTLSIGGTLSTSGGASSGGKSGVAVEVRKRRDFSSAGSNTSGAPVSGELSERARVLEEARKNAEQEEQRREEGHLDLGEEHLGHVREDHPRVFPIGKRDRRAIERARSLGVAAKFCGSGGAILAVHEDEALLDELCLQVVGDGFEGIRPQITEVVA